MKRSGGDDGTRVISSTHFHTTSPRPPYYPFLYCLHIIQTTGHSKVDSDTPRSLRKRERTRSSAKREGDLERGPEDIVRERRFVMP